MTGSSGDDAPRSARTVLGVSSGFHDSAAALLVDGRLEAAVAQERLSRVKHDASFPVDAMDAVLSIAGLDAADVDLVAYHERPLDVVGRHLASRLSAGPRAAVSLIRDTPNVLRHQLLVGHRVASFFERRGVRPPVVHYTDHHASHAASAFLPSPFPSAAILTLDGVGEWATATLGHGHEHRLQLEQAMSYPHSVGLLYSAFTGYCGFRVNGGEGELMGLAALGEPVHAADIMEHVVSIAPDGSVRLDPRYFSFMGGRRMVSRQFTRLFGGPARLPSEPITDRIADLAASIQHVVEEIVLRMGAALHERTGETRICLAGGVALNCVANGRLLRDGPFDEVWVQPAAGDDGGAIGAALHAWHETLGHPRVAAVGDGMRGGFLGPRFSASEVEDHLDAERVDHEVVDSREELARRVAGRLADGAVVGWCTGRMEFGPRALGHRSILADPRSSTVKDRVNSLIKERAGFRPFAPAVLEDRAAEWFDVDGAAPYMTFAATVRPDRVNEIPAVCHRDGSARIQTVDHERNPEFTQLIEAFDAVTGCPVLLNTSFNGADEPIVCTPSDALATARRIGLDLLVLEHCLVELS